MAHEYYTATVGRETLVLDGAAAEAGRLRLDGDEQCEGCGYPLAGTDESAPATVECQAVAAERTSYFMGVAAAQRARRAAKVRGRSLRLRCSCCGATYELRPAAMVNGWIRDLDRAVQS